VVGDGFYDEMVGVWVGGGGEKKKGEDFIKIHV